jgi:hypothetical protein
MGQGRMLPRGRRLQNVSRSPPPRAITRRGCGHHKPVSSPR